MGLGGGTLTSFMPTTAVDDQNRSLNWLGLKMSFLTSFEVSLNLPVVILISY